jgi:hypothetical protein
MFPLSARSEGDDRRVLTQEDVRRFAVVPDFFMQPLLEIIRFSVRDKTKI